MVRERLNGVVMSRFYTTWPIYFILFICVGLGGGCGGPPPVATFPVSGKVTVDGRPVASGQVSFTAVDEKVVAGLCTGTIGPDGDYKISSDGKPGSAAGQVQGDGNSFDDADDERRSAAVQCLLLEFQDDAFSKGGSEQSDRGRLRFEADEVKKMLFAGATMTTTTAARDGRAHRSLVFHFLHD